MKKIDPVYELAHLKHVFEGYSDCIKQDELNDYSPGSARWFSYDEGVKMAKADIELGIKEPAKRQGGLAK